MSFQQLIASKIKFNGLEGIRRHLQERERVKTHTNIDLFRSHLHHCIEELALDHHVMSATYLNKKTLDTRSGVFCYLIFFLFVRY